MSTFEKLNQSAEPSQKLTSLTTETTPLAIESNSQEASGKSSWTTEILQLFPKRSRNKAQILIHYVDKYLKVDDNQRVIYNDGTRGSHVVDLVRYSPFRLEHDTARGCASIRSGT